MAFINNNNNKRQKNIIVFYTDQQRADSLGCMGNSLAKTSNIDGLAAKGIVYTNHYSTNTICMPSRASFITGRYTQAHRVLDNGIFLPEDQLTMPTVFSQNGYRTASIGKLHFQPTDDFLDPKKNNNSMESISRWEKEELNGWSGPYYGFEEVQLAIGHGEKSYGHYGQWRNQNFKNLKIGLENALGNDNYPQFSCFKSNLPLEAHCSTWIADRAVDFIENNEKNPFYLNLSFPDPHHPFTPPKPYHSLFDNISFPQPHVEDGENKNKPSVYQNTEEGNPDKNSPPFQFSDFNSKAYHQIMAHTYGMIALIDDSIGRILSKLQAKGLAEETILVFTSDHGDFLGDHYLLYKAPLSCRSLLNVPLIIVDPEQTSGRVDHVCSNVDIMPTLLSKCGIEIPDPIQGVVLPALGENPTRDYAFASSCSKFGPDFLHYTIYKNEYRITIFPNLKEGELYNLEKDPFEHRNLYSDPNYCQIRNELTEELLFAIGKAEPEKPPIVARW